MNIEPELVDKNSSMKLVMNLIPLKDGNT